MAFALGDAMALFARANLVVLICNPGPTGVRVGTVALELDALPKRLLESDRPR